MDNVFIQIDVSMIIPTIQVYRDYFDFKYPCTDESNDGSSMPVEDEFRYAIYDYLLSQYNKMPKVYKQAYEIKKQKS